MVEFVGKSVKMRHAAIAGSEEVTLNATWTKFRSMMRGPAEAVAPTPKPVMATVPPEVGSLRDESALNAKVEALSSRIAAIESRVSSHSVASSDVLQDGSAANQLREAHETLSAQLTAVRETQARAAEIATADATKLITLEAAHRKLEEQFAAAALRERDLQQSLEFCEETMRSARQEWLTQATQRDREFTGRFAGLYVVSIVALLVSLATLALAFFAGRL